MRGNTSNVYRSHFAYENHPLCVVNTGCSDLENYFLGGSKAEIVPKPPVFGLTQTIRHTQRVGFLGKNDQSVAEAATYTTPNKHRRRKS
jgi:hypothetical protein